MEKYEIDYDDFDVKCARHRGIKHCYQCCRYKECFKEIEQNFPNVEVEKLVGAMILSALDDLYTHIPSLKNCKTKAQKERRNKIIYNQASAKNFFGSLVFHYSNMNFEYIRRVYEKEKIHKK